MGLDCRCHVLNHEEVRKSPIVNGRGWHAGVVQLHIAGLPLTSFRTIGAPSVQGASQCPFSLPWAGLEPPQ